MVTIDERLFETYGETVLKETGHGFDEGQLEAWLDALAVEEKVRYRIVDGLLDYYQHWAAAAFSAGLRLGLALLNDDVRRPCPEKG